MNTRPQILLALACALSLLTGCGTEASLPTTPFETPLGAISGAVHGGQQAVQGAHIYLSR